MSTAVTGLSCVLVGQRALLIAGEPGSGKSSLALALIDRGAVLVGDDGVVLERRGERLWASPPTAIAGLLEVRNVGLVTLPTGSGPVSLQLRLDADAPRFVEQAPLVEMLDCRVPAIAVWPHSPVLALRAEQAMARFGLPPT